MHDILEAMGFQCKVDIQHVRIAGGHDMSDGSGNGPDGGSEKCNGGGVGEGKAPPLAVKTLTLMPNEDMVTAVIEVPKERYMHLIKDGAMVLFKEEVTASTFGNDESGIHNEGHRPSLVQVEDRNNVQNTCRSNDNQYQENENRDWENENKEDNEGNRYNSQAWNSSRERADQYTEDYSRDSGNDGWN